jgi:tRNA(Ile)-lysidine synthetase-like protein
MSTFEDDWVQHPEWWFNCSSEIDQHLTKTYEHLLDDTHDHASPVEYILLNDQLVRHIFRNQLANHIIDYFLRKACEKTREILFALDFYDDVRFCFMLLPLRHTNDPGNIFQAMELCWQRIENMGDTPTLRRFLTAAYQRCPLIGASLVTDTTPYDPNDFSDVLDYCPTTQPSPMSSQCSLFEHLSTLSEPTPKIIISLSGGVDSMVCSWLLTQRYPTRDIVAVHINYNNRPTSDKEAMLVASWCSLLGIPCYTRKLHEILRKPCMDHGIRDVYESYTRNVRYQSYKDASGCGKSMVVLGHNKDDVLENIFTNIAQKCKFDDLDGMTEFSSQDNISFWRPLLKVNKADIITFAKSHNIPFLPNSTPPWSQRGQIRSAIVPTLNKWDDNFVDNMYNLSVMVKDLHASLRNQVTQYLSSCCCTNDDTGCITLRDIPNTTAVFWRELFKQTNVIVSEKSLRSFLERLVMTKQKQYTMTIMLSKNRKAILCHKDKTLMIFPVT